MSIGVTVRKTTRRQGLVDAAEQAYVRWINRFIRYQSIQSTEEMQPKSHQAIETDLFHLANEKQRSAASINQALSILVLMSREVLRVALLYLSIPRPLICESIALFT